MSRILLQQALDYIKETYDFCSVMQQPKEREEQLLKALEAELAKPEQEPATHAVIAGVLFDFMGWLTSRQKRLVLSSCNDASPAVKVIEEFAKMRGLLLDNAKVKNWQNMISSPRKELVGLTDDEIILMAHNDDDGDWIDPRYRTCWLKGYFDGGRAIEAKLKDRNT
jgi:hypothetical protein